MKIVRNALTAAMLDTFLAVLPRRVSGVFYNNVPPTAIGLYYGGDESVVITGTGWSLTEADVLARFPEALLGDPSLT